MLAIALGAIGAGSCIASILLLRRGRRAMRLASEQPDYLSLENAPALEAGYRAWRQTQARAVLLVMLGVFACGVLLGLQRS